MISNLLGFDRAIEENEQPICVHKFKIIFSEYKWPSFSVNIQNGSFKIVSFHFQGSNCQLPSGDISYWQGNRWDEGGQSWMGYR